MVRARGNGLKRKLKRAAVRLLAAMALLSAGTGMASATPRLLMELETGRVLSHQDAFKRWYPASLTKLMTAYVAFRAVQAGELQFGSPIIVSKHAAGEPPSKMGYPAGSELTLDNALKIVMVKSANDIATAIGETVGGSEGAFAERMNMEAKRLGMTGSHFVNAHGLPNPGQYTTARDLAVLVAALRRDFPQYMSYFAIEGIRSEKETLRNYNVLIGRFDGADGMKTGFICASGFNLIASATRGERTVVAIVLGALTQEARAEEAADLLAQGFGQSATTGPKLSELIRYGSDNDMPTDMRPEVCSAGAPGDRWEGREGRMIFRTPNIAPMERAPVLAEVGLGNISGPPTTQPRFADVPVPTPRPNYTPPPSAQGG
jgi:D-alanyl-D-alanine carboxypeptidase